MTESGTATFTNPDDYCAAIRGAHENLILTGPGDFKARLTWLKLRHLHVIQGRESVARISYVSLQPDRAFVSFLQSSEAPLIWNGIELGARDLVFHSLGEHAHQWTKGPSQWSVASLPFAKLLHYGKVLTDRRLAPPPVGRVLRPQSGATAQLRRLLSAACRLAETKPEIIAYREAARALEHDLICALVKCLTTAEPRGGLTKLRHRTDVMLRFESALTADVVREPSIPKLCTIIGVPERTLRACCAEFFGVAPSRFLRLRRLNLVRAALQRADPATTSVAEIAQGYQFADLGRFAAKYRTVFGEKPSETLQRTTD